MTDVSKYWLRLHRLKFTEKTTIGQLLDAGSRLSLRNEENANHPFYLMDAADD